MRMSTSGSLPSLVGGCDGIPSASPLKARDSHPLAPLGDDLVTADWQGSAAASLSVGGQGGTGCVPSLDTTRAHLAVHDLVSGALVRK